MADAFFADTLYYVAVLNAQDTYHERAMEWAELLADEAHFWTTDAVLLEVAGQLGSPVLRGSVARAIREILEASDSTVVRLTPDLFDRALGLYERRPDKEWSLTDCLSFVVMQEVGISGALTSDHHFVQAGFRALLREEAVA